MSGGDAATPLGSEGQVDTAFIWRALDSANLNALRIALYHQTREPRLAAMRVVQRPLRGGAFRLFALAPEHSDEVRHLAFEYLVSGQAPRPEPTKKESAELMELFTGSRPTPTEVDYGFEELSFENFPRDVTWSGEPPAERLADFRVTIIGAGFSGIAAGVLLDRLGISYRIIDRQDGIGGTWRLNGYPEARVDVPSLLYQYKFEKRYPWKSNYATRDELLEYLDHIVDSYGVRHKISLNTTLLDATWDAARSMWTLKTAEPDGSHTTLESDVVISASGLFSTPKLPDITGIESFRGAIFHSTAWEHSFDITDKRIAVIGTGSTGSQLLRGIVGPARHVTVFQRTPNWVTPLRGYRAAVPAESLWLQRTMPGYWNWLVYAHYLAELQMQELQVVDHEWRARGGRVSERNEALATSLKEFIRSKVGDDDELFEALIPPYPPLARRLVMDNEWYESLMRDDVELVTDGISRITEQGIVTADGVERDVDLIVLCAGFEVAKYLWPVPYKGRNGLTLEELWKPDGARAYLGITLPHFPNFFILYGPNGQARGGGFHSWAENLARYAVSLIVELLERNARTVEVREEAFDDYNRRLDKAHADLLWELEGVGGYYVNEHGRSGVNMPWSVHEYYDMIRQPDLGDYRFGDKETDHG